MMKPIKSFVSLDVETATGKRNSICAIGMVKVVDGELTDKLYSLVRPPDNKYSPFNIKIHGIHPAETEEAMNFAELWPEIKEFIGNDHIVCHNSSFDASCMRAAMEYYRIKSPNYFYHCTYRLAKTKGINPANLPAVCRHYGIRLDSHHNAMSDCIASGKIFIKMQQRG